MNKLLGILALAILLSGCTQTAENPPSATPTAPTTISTPSPPTASSTPVPHPTTPRLSKVPADAVKMAPATDAYPPILHSEEFEQPVPLPPIINSAGAEDSPFITPDGSTLYFFFTPDVRVPVEKQLLDEVTGMYVSEKVGGGWSEAKRVWLQEPGKLALDGCEFVQGKKMWFCSAREGYNGINWFTAEYRDGRWQGWKNADFPADYEVGELHISADGNRLFFGSAKPGTKGQLDLWVSEKTGGGWGEPVNLAALNTPENEGWPYLTPDGSELWFLRTVNGTPAVMRSKRSGESWTDWSEPELIVSQFAGEPAFDSEGNLYFVHHYFKDGKMLEADIYLAKKK